MHMLLSSAHYRIKTPKSDTIIYEFLKAINPQFKTTQRHPVSQGKNRYITRQQLFRSTWFFNRKSSLQQKDTSQRALLLPVSSCHDYTFLLYTLFWAAVSIHSFTSCSLSFHTRTYLCNSFTPHCLLTIVFLSYLPRIFRPPKERLLEFSCWESCNSQNTKVRSKFNPAE